MSPGLPACSTRATTTSSWGSFGLRRTQTVAGGVLKTAPFHWSGDQSDLTQPEES
ncbi:hypothetical protein [Sorangium sp. So ce1024]|uniref:hypothetical protein n=1 Tax=Sorangium sp. So ce1024 TaxID=3133327 RepID=UPI003F07D185